MSIGHCDSQMIFGDLVGLKLPDICLTCEENPRKNFTQETYPDRGSNPGPLRDRRLGCRLLHNSGPFSFDRNKLYGIFLSNVLQTKLLHFGRYFETLFYREMVESSIGLKLEMFVTMVFDL